MSNPSEIELAHNARTLAKCICALFQTGFVRESLLLRLVTSGFALDSAVSLRTNQVLESFSFGHELDPYCRSTGMRDLRAEILTYIRQSVVCGDSTADANYPLFPSRKGGGPITTRSAERLLKNAFVRLGAITDITYRFAAHLGRNLRRLRKQGVCASRDVLEEVMTECRREILLAYPHRIHDQEDAQQTIIVHLLEQCQDGMLNKDDAIELATKQFRRFRRERDQLRRTEVSGILGDWTTVVNRGSAQLLYGDHQSEVEDSFNSKDANLQLAKIIRLLPARDQRIMRLRTGVGTKNCIPHSRAEVAAKFSVSPERIRQIEYRSIRRLQRP